MNAELATNPRSIQKGMALPPEIHDPIQKWSNSFFRPSIPTNLIKKSVVTEVKDERAKVLTAQFLYGERNGTEKEIPYDDREIGNSTDNRNEESLWLYGGGLAHAPAGFSEKSQSKFNIPTGRTKKCPRCKGEGKTDCFACKGSGKRESDKSKECQYCNGTGKKRCGHCAGYRYVQVVIEVRTRFKVEETKEHDYQGEVPPNKLKNTTGAVIFEKTANYPEDRMRKMLKGGIDRQEYAELQSGIATVFHSQIGETLQTYDGDIRLVHGLVDNFFKQIPNAFKENSVLDHEILPVRLRIKVEDVPVKKVSYTYKVKPYTLWVYGNEKKVHARKRPLGFTGRLIISWVVQLMIVGLIIHWFTGWPLNHASNNPTPVAATTVATAQTPAESFEKTRKAAEQGSPDTQTRLGTMYAKGEGVAKDPAEAVKWFTKAADQGFAQAQNNLGVSYQQGSGVAKDLIEAGKWYRKAAGQGYAEAEINLGAMYAEGDGVPKDPAEALEWFSKAAAQGSPRGQSSMGLLYINGNGVTKDPAEAAKWFRKAAEQGFAQAQFNLGIMYCDGNGVEKDPAEGAKWFRKAAEQGNAKAQNSLGVRYHKGDGVAKDPVEALKWFRKAAEQGNSTAQNNLGVMYDNGDGAVKDPVEALRWFREAAEQGNASAQNTMGAMCYQGDAVPKDPRQAAKWFTMAANQGCEEAQYNLAGMYYRGDAVSKDYVLAYQWYALAASQGHEDAKRQHLNLPKLMSPEQIAQAEQLVRDFVPKTTDE